MEGGKRQEGDWDVRSRRRASTIRECRGRRLDVQGIPV